MEWFRFRKREIRPLDSQIPLAVIDVQKDYSCAHNVIFTDNIVKHVRLAMERNAPIFLVEYSGYGPTVPAITKHLKKYPHVMTVEKYACDGGSAIHRAAEEHFDITKATYQLCGLYTCDCVQKTAKGLMYYGHAVEIIEEACYASSPYHNEQVEIWQNEGKVKITHQSPDWRRAA